MLQMMLHYKYSKNTLRHFIYLKVDCVSINTKKKILDKLYNIKNIQSQQEVELHLSGYILEDICFYPFPKIY